MKGRSSLFVFLTGLALVTGTAAAFVRAPGEWVATGRFGSVPELLNMPSPVGTPIAELPRHVPTRTGRLTVFADFSQRTPEEDFEIVVDEASSSRRPRTVLRVPVYVVNRTGK